MKYIVDILPAALSDIIEALLPPKRLQRAFEGTESHR
jgi:hypothetical protein